MLLDRLLLMRLVVVVSAVVLSEFVLSSFVVSPSDVVVQLQQWKVQLCVWMQRLMFQLQLSFLKM